ncbi:MAG: hypothetical protein J1E83_06375 [Lachnospiraceae bacterium]|nr:hypothetical protein [Lachnospiraceae bacterium]
MYEDYLSKALSNIIMAKQAIKAFMVTNNKDMKNGASYHAQQAIEFIIKHEIYNNVNYNKGGNNFPQIITHDLDKLIKTYCIPYEVHVPKKIAKSAKMYTSWEAESRYSLHYSVRLDSVNMALNEAQQWLIQIKPSYKAKITSVNKKLDL